MKRRYEGRIRPAGESSDEDELLDYMSENSPKPEIKSYTRTIDKEEAENERIFQLFLRGNSAEVAALIDEGFDVNKRLKDNWTPLLLAASVGAPEITALLIENGADVNIHRDYYTPLMAAASCPKTTSGYENSLLVVCQLLKNKVDANAKTRKRETALMFAAMTGNCSIIKELLPYCDKYAEDNQGWTALFWAVNGNSMDAVKLLLEEELPYDKFDVRGNLPIYYAKENGFADIIDTLPNLTEEENTITCNEFGYQDFFDHGRSCFLQDVVTILYGMKNERYVQHFLNNEVNLFNFLTLTEDGLKNIGVKMPYERYQILSGLYRLHKHPFKTKALPIVGKSESYSLLSATRQFIVMQGSLRYIQMNLQNPNELKGFTKEIQKMKESLIKIRLVVDKISTKAAEWDRETAPADLITKESCRKLKSSKFKYCFTISVLSVSVYAMCKKFKFFHTLP
ncbi:ankyrin repeat sam and basic leucine zipper domain-containing protein 1 [Holotrichia oblita]|uniref:Ankyrin repeat sam and basic leucine zipper domain-containing protein 1 n=1 Tax=Holotrichia oblita TaxID=644536 RepID=A0ACB9SYE1_HOLOL|nr:ankyrin repeat sam and basic leucine zipper domain-containing protein 1 [Holotrichia oblita]